MSEGKEPYGVEPGEPGSKGTPPESKPRLADVPSPAPKGKIEAPELLSGFDEDADFDKDPELDRVILGKPAKEPAPEEKKPPEDFVQPGLGGAKVWAIVGVVLLVMALIATGVRTDASAGQRLLRVLLMLYNTLLHTGTGVVALFVAATLLGKRLGSFELAGARMLSAVGAFALVFSLQLSLFGVLWLDRIVVLVFAAGAYVLVVASTFNLWKKHPLGFVVGSHFFLWLIVAIGMLLTGAIKPVVESARPAQPAAQPAGQPSGGAKPATGG